MKSQIGVNHPQAKLTEQDVRNIRELLAIRENLRNKLANLTIQAIADKFEIHEGHVRKIASRDSWSHI